MAGTNSRNDAFYVGNLNGTPAEYTSTPERYWAGGTRPSYLESNVTVNADNINVDISDDLEAQTAALIAAMDADNQELLDSLKNDDFEEVE